MGNNSELVIDYQFIYIDLSGKKVAREMSELVSCVLPWFTNLLY